MIIVRITMQVLPEKQKEMMQTLLSLMDPMEREPGCLSYTILYDMQDNNLLYVFEEWENRNKLNDHLKSDMFGVLLGTRSLLRHSHGIHIYTVQKTEGISSVVALRDQRDEINLHDRRGRDDYPRS